MSYSIAEKHTSFPAGHWSCYPSVMLPNWPIASKPTWLWPWEAHGATVGIWGYAGPVWSEWLPRQRCSCVSASPPPWLQSTDTPLESHGTEMGTSQLCLSSGKDVGVPPHLLNLGCKVLTRLWSLTVLKWEQAYCVYYLAKMLVCLRISWTLDAKYRNASGVLQYLQRIKFGALFYAAAGYVKNYDKFPHLHLACKVPTHLWCCHIAEMGPYGMNLSQSSQAEILVCLHRGINGVNLSLRSQLQMLVCLCISCTLSAKYWHASGVLRHWNGYTPTVFIIKQPVMSKHKHGFRAKMLVCLHISSTLVAKYWYASGVML